jgi:hypothetical protein
MTHYPGEPGRVGDSRPAGEQPSGEMAACCGPPQLPCCRGVARIAISEIAKRNRTAKLIRLMTANGMFSRYRTSRPQIDRTPR